MTLRAGIFAIVGLASLAIACNGGGSEEQTPPDSTPVAQPSPADVTPGPQASPAPSLCERSVPETGEANLFPNPGFEEDADPWYSLKPPDFIVSDEFAHSGSASALLRMDEPPEAADTKIFYLVQELAPAELPEVISGYYRVENWNKGTPIQYLQFVVIAPGATNLAGGFPNYQIRYLLAGLDEPPFEIANAFFVFVTEKDPVTGEWVRFERNLREDFEQLWGAVPQGFDCLRVLFEVRYDDKVAGDGAAVADVYYDDLYIGPALASQ